MVDPNIFAAVPIFAALDVEERQVLAQQVSLRQFVPGEQIHQAGERSRYAYLIQAGKVRITVRDVNQEDVAVNLLGDGSLCGMSAIIAEAPHLTTATVVEETTAIEIDRGDIQVLLEQKPQAGLDMMTMMERQARATQEILRTQASRNANEAIAETEGLGERMADAVARFGGSWRFVISFGVLIAVYVSLNVVLGKPWDPYPFILLNLFLSMLAAMQAPIIMMSQENRQDAKDRLRSELDYRVNLKAELEIEELILRMGQLEERLRRQ